ncbi:unnamed protein product [Ambrosiozyma monospora]|uniref:glucan 1,3-beta-glucosidase n=1 Tax=Ambrosiozyma monospora TaxID=43982 RepID=A0A9W6YZJ8_AMBMO|nr:unnamed protein product [Ambrosiozyma monospora]
MKLTSFLIITSSASLVSALGELGFDLGVRITETQCKVPSDYHTDLDVISPYVSTIKVFSASDCQTLEILGPIAEEHRFTISMGLWPAPANKFNDEKAALQQFLPTIRKATIKSFLVGSEALYRGDVTPEQLAGLINEVRDFVKDIKDKEGATYDDIPVGTVDSWNSLTNVSTAAVVQNSDILFANAFSYWQGQNMQNASYSFFDDIMQALKVIETTKGTTDLEFWIGETGWPTGGSNYGESVPSVENARKFWKEGICAIRAWGINTYVFEAFDETWKPVVSGSDAERYWGAFDDGRNLKYDLSCDFSSSPTT